MSKNTGISYEVLTQRIFQALVNQDAVKNVRVDQDITINGLTTNHQIDVYWEFQVGGVLYRTAVQAKDWAQTVDQGKVLQFKAVLDDIPGQVRGIFVTKKGYQEGARNVAAAHDILLYELREPHDDDLTGRVGHLKLEMTLVSPNVSNLRLFADETWLSDERDRRGLPHDPAIPFSTEGMTDALSLREEDGTEIGNVRNVLKPLYSDINVETPAKQLIHLFKKPTFLKTGVEAFPLLKLTGIKAIVSVTKEKLPSSYSTPEGVVGFILKNVIQDRVSLFTDKLSPIK